MKQNVDPEKVKKVIAIIIAILTAIAGAFGEAKTSVLSNLLNL